MARPQKSEETAIVELEGKFRALPTLKVVGMALMQFALKLQGTDELEKDIMGVFCMTFVSFDLLPLKIEDGVGDGLAVCEITHHAQLGQAAKYILIAHNCHLVKTQINSDSAD